MLKYNESYKLFIKNMFILISLILFILCGIKLGRYPTSTVTDENKSSSSKPSVQKDVNNKYCEDGYCDFYNKKYSGFYKIGAPYSRKGNLYEPRQVDRYFYVGYASWYGDTIGSNGKHSFQGRPTANGEIYNKDDLTAAHPTLPLPCIVRVTNIETGVSVLVRVNDRGPFLHDRGIDLSEAAFNKISTTSLGVVEVSVEYLHEETLSMLHSINLQRK